MKILMPILILLCVSSSFTQAEDLSSDYTYLGLPEGVKARLGKGNIAWRSQKHIPVGKHSIFIQPFSRTMGTHSLSTIVMKSESGMSKQDDSKRPSKDMMRWNKVIFYFTRWHNISEWA